MNRFTNAGFVLALSSLLVGDWESRGASDPAEAEETEPTTNEHKTLGSAAGSGAESASTMKEVLVIGQSALPVFLSPPPRDLIERPLTESPGLETATTIVSREEIEWLNVYSMVDAMKYVPGAWTETRGRKEKQLFSLRGQRYPYPGYLVDGAWFREFTETTFFLNAASVERLEITRSSSDLLLTPGGMAGNVNIVPRTYERPETELRTEYGSFDTVLGQLSHGDALGKGSYGLGLGYYHTDGPEDRNAVENMADLYGRVLYPVTPRLQLSLMGYWMYGDRELKLAEPPADLSFQTRRESFDPMRYYLLVGKARYQLEDRATTELTVNYGDRRFSGERVGSTNWLEKDNEIGARLIQSLRLTDENHLRFGGIYNHWQSPTGKRYYLGNPGDLHTYAGVISDEQEFGPLTVNLGYRFGRTYYEEFGGFHVEGSQQGISAVKVRNEWDDPLHTVNLGGKYELSDRLALRANVAWGQIASQPGLLTTNLTRPGTETRLKYDLGFKWEARPVGEISVTGFYVDQRDAALAMAKSIKVAGVPFVLFENTDAESLGVELEARSRRFDNGLLFFVNSVFMTTRRVEQGEWQTDAEVPEIILGGGLSYHYERFEVGLQGKYVGSYENNRFLPAGSPAAAVGDFTDLSVALSYYLGKHRQHRLYLAVENLTDEEYSTVAGYPDEGRRFKGGLSLRF